jgi:hypothetical protein
MKKSQKIKAEMQVTDMEQELIEVMFRKGNITMDMLLKDTVGRWIHYNTDLLTAQELEKYEAVFGIMKNKVRKTAEK